MVVKIGLMVVNQTDQQAIFVIVREICQQNLTVELAFSYSRLTMKIY